ncbi:MAG: iron-containing alcohol dehydrogenase [Oscillospiraceae bacterium]|jgi:alcohol dehydrogenase class IV|nr:iron-containing alcohol dehydrogenase [Oscillospiraceae bacterium]
MYQEFTSGAGVIFGRGSITILGEKLAALGCRKALLVFDKGSERAGIVARAVASLDSAGVSYAAFDGVIADPTDAVVDAAGAAAIAAGADCLVGIGGGSSMDTAKAAAILLSGNPAPVKNYILAHPISVATTAPVILVPTTAGTGSECTRVAIISRPDVNAKWSVYVNTTLAVVDPELMLTLPPAVTAHTGLDALAHAVEAYTSNCANIHADLYALGAIRKIAGSLVLSYQHPDNIEYRSEMAIAANWAGMAFRDPLTHMGHAIGDAFSVAFHTPHGHSCALGLAEVMRFVAPFVPERMADIAAALGLELRGNESGETLGNMVADAIYGMMRAMNVQSLHELGATREQVVALAPSVADSHLSSYCPTPVTVEVAEMVLGRVWDGYR